MLVLSLVKAIHDKPLNFQDFCLGGGGHPADATRYFFRNLRKPTICRGGGVVAEIFHPRQQTRISGGGVVVEMGGGSGI